MKEIVCSEWAAIRRYLELRAEGAAPAESEDGDSVDRFIRHLSKCTDCRAAYIDAVTSLHEDERTFLESAAWARATGLRAAALVGAEMMQAEVGAPAMEGPAPASGLSAALRGMAKATESWLQQLVNQARAFHVSISMPSELAFAGARSAGAAVALQQFPFEFGSLARGGWDPAGVAWISPKEILLQLRPALGVVKPRTPRVAFRSNANELLWIDELVRPEVLADGSYLFLVWRLDASRRVDAQVVLPLDGFVWFPED